MNPAWQTATNELMGLLPFSPQLAWQLRSRRGSFGRYNLEHLRRALPGIAAQAAAFAAKAPRGKRVALLATIHYWVEYCAVLGLALASQGHRVTFGYFPYADYRKSTSRFDRRFQAYYTRRTLDTARPVMETRDLLAVPCPSALPPELEQAVERVTTFDTQSVLQVEEVDRGQDF